MPGINTSTPPYRVLCEAVGLPVPPQSTPSPVTGRNQNRGYGQQQWPQQQYQPTFQHQHQQYGGFSQNPGPGPYQFQQQGYGHGHGHGPGMNLSPLLVPQNMALGQMRGQRHDQSDPNLTPMPGHGSPRTPVPQYPNPNPNLHSNQRRGQNQMMSPTSDPFNPVSHGHGLHYNNDKKADESSHPHLSTRRIYPTPLLLVLVLGFHLSSVNKSRISNNSPIWVDWGLWIHNLALGLDKDSKGRGRGSIRVWYVIFFPTARSEIPSWILMDRWEECTLPVHRTSHQMNKVTTIQSSIKKE